MSADPHFADFETTIAAGGRAVPIRPTADALHAIWGEDVGPQTAQAIFDENRALFDAGGAIGVRSSPLGKRLSIPATRPCMSSTAMLLERHAAYAGVLSNSCLVSCRLGTGRV